MYPPENIIAFLFATVATIVATLTGLIGVFSVSDQHLLIDVTKQDNYASLEKIYDRNLASVELLKQAVLQGTPSAYHNEMLLDIDNIRRNQLIHDQKKTLTLAGFKTSLVFVFLSLVL